VERGGVAVEDAADRARVLGQGGDGDGDPHGLALRGLVVESGLAGAAGVGVVAGVEVDLGGAGGERDEPAAAALDLDRGPALGGPGAGPRPPFGDGLVGEVEHLGGPSPPGGVLGPLGEAVEAPEVAVEPLAAPQEQAVAVGDDVERGVATGPARFEHLAEVGEVGAQVAVGYAGRAFEPQGLGGTPASARSLSCGAAVVLPVQPGWKDWRIWSKVAWPAAQFSCLVWK
jgi:hypothetical protein